MITPTYVKIIIEELIKLNFYFFRANKTDGVYLQFDSDEVAEKAYNSLKNHSVLDISLYRNIWVNCRNITIEL